MKTKGQLADVEITRFKSVMKDVIPILAKIEIEFEDFYASHNETPAPMPEAFLGLVRVTEQKIISIAKLVATVMREEKDKESPEPAQAGAPFEPYFLRGLDGYHQRIAVLLKTVRDLDNFASVVKREMIDGNNSEDGQFQTLALLFDYPTLHEWFELAERLIEIQPKLEDLFNTGAVTCFSKTPEQFASDLVKESAME